MGIKLPIEAEKIIARSLSDRFWGADPKHNFYVRAKNVVISGDLNRSILAQIQNEYEGDLGKDFSHQWEELLEEIVYCIAIDGRIDADEKIYFKEYISIFGISIPDAQMIYRKGARRAYMDIVIRLCRDDELSDKDLELLGSIAKHFGLNEHEEDAALQDQLKRMVQASFDDLARGGMVSDTAWEEFTEHAAALRVDFQLDERGKEAVERARNRWRVRYGQMQTIELHGDYRLKSKEKAYYQGVASWLELRSNAGVVEYMNIGTGTIIMTDQRVLFIGQIVSNKSIGWNKLLTVKSHGPDAFELEKETGKSPIIDVQRTRASLEALASQIAYRLWKDSVIT
ncbi:hypothetical protein COB72_01890 [bacterium]|nr:MAG: hypothetical protein COB72_01890 [bacterium]